MSSPLIRSAGRAPEVRCRSEAPRVQHRDQQVVEADVVLVLGLGRGALVGLLGGLRLGDLDDRCLGSAAPARPRSGTAPGGAAAPAGTAPALRREQARLVAGRRPATRLEAVRGQLGLQAVRAGRRCRRWQLAGCRQAAASWRPRGLGGSRWAATQSRSIAADAVGRRCAARGREAAAARRAGSRSAPSGQRWRLAGWSATDGEVGPAVGHRRRVIAARGTGAELRCSSDGSGDAGWYPDVSTCWPLSACGSRRTRTPVMRWIGCRPAPLSDWGDLANAGGFVRRRRAGSLRAR